MDILILYKSYRIRERRTAKDHLYAFSRYVGDCRFVYLDVGSICGIPRCIAYYPFDAVILHYLFLAFRLDQPAYRRLYGKIGETLRGMSGVKVMIPHDEYLCTEALWQIARDCGVSRIYTSCYPHDYAALFPPDQVGSGDLLRTVLTGYVDETLRKSVDRMFDKQKRRTFDIGYRALRSGYTFGRHGRLKTEVAEAFAGACRRRPALRTDIRMTSDSYQNTITGVNWLRYLLDCRATIGCLGGSSLLDPDGTLRARTRAYLAEHPDAPYAAVEANCFPGLDGRIAAYLLGPRHLECAMTRTCQLLVEGDYHGVLQAGRDYIAVKADFSNIDEVLDLVADGETCKRIAEQCYENVALSGRYTYRAFANEIVDDIRSLCGDAGQPGDGRSRLPFVRMRTAAALAHAVNQSRNAAVNAAKAAVALLTRNNPALYETVKRWYKRG